MRISLEACEMMWGFRTLAKGILPFFLLRINTVCGEKPDDLMVVTEVAGGRGGERINQVRKVSEFIVHFNIFSRIPDVL